MIDNPAVNRVIRDPEVSTNGRRIPVPRGRILGGSSSINGLVFVRGQARDFGEVGESGWSADVRLSINDLKTIPAATSLEDGPAL